MYLWYYTEIFVHTKQKKSKIPKDLWVEKKILSHHHFPHVFVSLTWHIKITTKKVQCFRIHDSIISLKSYKVFHLSTLFFTEKNRKLFMMKV
jgi:hypothetical protein